MIENRFLSYQALGLLLVCFTAARCFQYPPYIKPCAYDGSLSQCIIDQLHVIKPHFKEEIKELGIPVISPFHVPKLTLNVGENLKIKLTDLDILYIDEFEEKKLIMDTATGEGEVVFHFATIGIVGTYDIDGQILILPIKGQGPVNISVADFTVNYSFKLTDENKNGQTYGRLSEQTFSYDSGKISMVLGNLFNGDKVLADQVNTFLNDNWREVEQLVRPAIVETIYAVVGAVFRKVFDAAPLNKIFLS